jgi:hypothetical protein
MEFYGQKLVSGVDTDCGSCLSLYGGQRTENAVEAVKFISPSNNVNEIYPETTTTLYLCDDRTGAGPRSFRTATTGPTDPVKCDQVTWELEKA